MSQENSARTGKGRRANVAAICVLAVFLAVGGILVGFGADRYAATEKKIKSYVSVEGRVVSHREKQSWDDDREDYTLLYAEVVGYTVNGKSYTISSGVYSNRPRPVGASVTVWYDPARPEQAVMSGLRSDCMLILVGAFFLAISGVMLALFLIRAARSRRKTS